mmetsp:Transcript_2640/g.4442  ORF Transcript_2640/g.4442 Transcript_2640/m.4442 type:complete len:237 (+) Transcript_2640:1649-2359(+)
MRAPPPVKAGLVRHLRQDRGVVQECELGQHDLHLVPNVLDGPRQRCHHIPEPSHLGNGCHLHCNVHDVQGGRLGGGPRGHEVVVQAHGVVVLHPLLVPPRRAEHAVHHVCVLRHFDGGAEVRAVRHVSHLDWRQRSRVGPAVEARPQPDLFGPLEVGVLVVVEDGNLLARHRVSRLRVQHVHELLAQHFGGFHARACALLRKFLLAPFLIELVHEARGAALLEERHRRRLPLCLRQ